MSKIDSTIKKLQSLINDDNCQYMNKSTLKGYLGELMVKQRLEMEGCRVTHRGNQAGYDLEIEEYGYKLDVKTSMLKQESKAPVKHWGWALLMKHKSLKNIKPTHYVCVSLGDDLSAKSMYVISSANIKSLPCGAANFKNVKKGFVVPERTPKKSYDKKWEKLYAASNRLIRENKAIYCQGTMKGRKLINALKKCT